MNPCELLIDHPSTASMKKTNAYNSNNINGGYFNNNVYTRNSCYVPVFFLMMFILFEVTFQAIYGTYQEDFQAVTNKKLDSDYINAIGLTGLWRHQNFFLGREPPTPRKKSYNPHLPQN